MRALNREQFMRYANAQIEVAEQILAVHLPDGNGWCSCGRPQPCSVSGQAAATCERYRAQLALLDSTVVLPVLIPQPEVRQVALWRRLIGCLR